MPPKGYRKYKSHCKRGHERTRENTTPGGQCRECNRITTESTREKRSIYNRTTKRLNKYGLTSDELTRLEQESGGHCGICKRKFTRTPHIDHNHVTGKVRGLLCNNCNRGIGHLQDNPAILRAAIWWIERD